MTRQTAKLRETLKEMRKMPRDVIRVVRLYKKRIEKGEKVEHDPKVKSVIVANLLKNVQKVGLKLLNWFLTKLTVSCRRLLTFLVAAMFMLMIIACWLLQHMHSLVTMAYIMPKIKIMTTAWLRGFANSQKR